MNDLNSTSGAQSIEQSAGTILIRIDADEPQGLIIRIRREGFEFPKGHVEPGETSEQAAIRELREETALFSEVVIGSEVGRIQYELEKNGARIQKAVVYYVAFAETDCMFDKRPKGTREIRWIAPDEIETVPLVNEDLRPILTRAFKSMD